TTICATVSRALERGDRVNIGGPTSNARGDGSGGCGAPVAGGGGGELLFGGGGGWWGLLVRGEMTAVKVVPDGFGEEAGGRLYRTRDLVRWLAEGELEFLGRIDFQVKLRGHRIELGEIEAALGEQEGVRQAVVVKREERLIGYVVGEVD